MKSLRSFRPFWTALIVLALGLMSGVATAKDNTPPPFDDTGSNSNSSSSSNSSSNAGAVAGAISGSNSGSYSAAEQNLDLNLGGMGSSNHNSNDSNANASLTGKVTNDINYNSKMRSIGLGLAAQSLAGMVPQAVGCLGTNFWRKRYFWDGYENTGSQPMTGEVCQLAITVENLANRCRYKTAAKAEVRMLAALQNLSPEEANAKWGFLVDDAFDNLTPEECAALLRPRLTMTGNMAPPVQPAPAAQLSPVRDMNLSVQCNPSKPEVRTIYRDLSKKPAKPKCVNCCAQK